MVPDSEGFHYPSVDDATCIKCGLCVKICPVIHRPEPRAPLAVYAAVHHDGSLRLRSSSGGLFSVLARHVLSEGGIVYGAGWSSDFRVVHKSAETEEELADLRGSKYAQSDLGDIVKQVNAQLGKGRKVLFSGTPCQIAGLRAYVLLVRRNNCTPLDNLMCVDVICHAVPSPKVFALYKHELEARQGAPAASVSFRNKRCGWKRYALALVFKNGKEYLSPQDTDPYLRGFVKDLFNRPSCSECAFRDLRSGADITLADYWQVQKRFPEMDDDQGTSLVLAVTSLGLETVRALQGREGGQETTWRESDYADVREHNPAVCQSPCMHKNRGAFFKRLESGSVVTVMKRLLRPSFSRRCRAFLKRVKSKVFATSAMPKEARL